MTSSRAASRPRRSRSRVVCIGWSTGWLVSRPKAGSARRCCGRSGGRERPRPAQDGSPVPACWHDDPWPGVGPAAPASPGGGAGVGVRGRSGPAAASSRCSHWPAVWLANHAVTVADRHDRRHRLVLRRWARPGWDLDDPDYTAQREATILELLGPSAVPAPEVVAADPEGTACDVPALLLTRLPGRSPSADTGRPARVPGPTG